MYDGWFAGSHRTFKSRFELCGCFHIFPVAAHSCTHLVVSDGGMIMSEPVGLASELPQLRTLFHTVGPVHGNDDYDWQFIADSSFELLHIETKGTVSGHTVDRPLRKSQFGTEGIRQAGAEMSVIH